MSEKPPCLGYFMKCPAEKVHNCEWRVDCYDKWCEESSKKACAALPTNVLRSRCEECE